MRTQQKLSLFTIIGFILASLFLTVNFDAKAQDSEPEPPVLPYIEPAPVEREVVPTDSVPLLDAVTSSSVTAVTLPSGDSSIHGLIYNNGYLWASTRTIPGRILKIDPTTLTVAGRVILASGQDNAEAIVSAKGYIWSITSTDPANLVRVDPNTMAVQVFPISQSGTSMAYGESLLYAYGKLWAGGFNKITEIDITNVNAPSYTFYNYNALIHATYIWAWALSSDGTYLWATFTQANASPPAYTGSTVVRIDPNNPASYTHQDVSSVFPDDMVNMAGYLYTSSENSGLPSQVYQFPTSITPYTTSQALSTGISYGTFTNTLETDTFWGAYTNSPGKLLKFDLDLNKVITVTLPTGSDDPSEIVFDPSGIMYVSTFQAPAGMVRYTPPNAVNLTISKSGSNALLSWNNSDALVNHYEVWRSTKPYFNPGDAGSANIADVTATVGAMSYTDIGAVGDVNNNHFYVVRAFNNFGLLAPISNRVGEFNRELRETASTDFNWIALPLDANLSMASDLATFIQNNSNSSISVLAIEQWNPVGQNYQTFVPPSSGNFSLKIGGIYRVSVNIIVGSSVVWTLSGSVPDPGTYSLKLYETASSDLNWVMMPLDKNSITMASGLKADIDSNAIPATTAIAVEEWNFVAQNYSTYVPPTGNFPVRIGYPYRVSVNVLSGTESTWP